MNSAIKSILSFAGITALAISFNSCSEKDAYDTSLLYPNAVVTVKPVDDNASFYLQLDDETTLGVENLSKSPFGKKEVRALVNFEETGLTSETYDRVVRINWIDSLLTKQLVQDLGDENDTRYGSDPVEIANSWINIVEDGYLTLQFMAWWGNTGIAHEVNLLNAGTEEDPYIVEFRHNAHGDRYGNTLASGIVAFKLDELASGLGLPDTEGKTVDLTFRYESFSGTKSLKFKYCTRESTEAGEINPATKFSLSVR